MVRCSSCDETIFDGRRFYDCSCSLNRAAGNGKCVAMSLASVEAQREEVIAMKENGRVRIAHIERSEKYPQLRWVQFDVGEERYSLWDQVFDGELALGQLVEFEAVPVDGRNFHKITSIRPVRSRRPKAKASTEAASQAQEACDRFSKTEIGLMASVALKVAAKLVKNPDDSKELFSKADALYAWLAEKRVKELADQAQ